MFSCYRITNLIVLNTIISEINIPTTIIWGENDEFLKWNPQSDIVINDLNVSSKNIHLLNAKHFIQEEQPKEITKLIIDFLKH